MSDSSPAVRDAAVELVGKYVVKKPSLAAEYYPHIALRVTVSVRRGPFLISRIPDSASVKG